MTQNKQSKKFYSLTSEVAAKLREAKLTAAEWRIWSYLIEIDTWDNSDRDLDHLDIIDECDCSKATFYRAIAKLQEIELLPQWLDIKNYNNVEQKICARLKDSLGGLTEVSTPAGRIDLLTDDEIIEVKRIDRWKAALGQILVYSGFYPHHRKRLHLFGRRDELTKVADIEAACMAFAVKVTAEEV